MSQYDELLKELGNLRNHALQAKEVRDNIIAEAKANSVYHQADLIYEEDNQKIAETERKIKDIAFTEWVNTQNKHPHEKIEVKIFKTFKVISADVLREWVLKNLPAALSPDLKKVEKYCLEIGPVEGTEKGEEARVQIASKL